MDNKYMLKINGSIKYYFEVKDNLPIKSDENKTLSKITHVNKCCTDIEDDIYIDTYVNYNLLDTCIYKW